MFSGQPGKGAQTVCARRGRRKSYFYCSRFRHKFQQRGRGAAERAERTDAKGTASRGEARASPRSAHQNGHFPSAWKMSGMPRAVGRAGRSISRKAAPVPARAAQGSRNLARGWPRRCPPPHAAFRTRCPRTVQRVRSEAHYAAAVPRPAQPAAGDGPGGA